MKKYPLLIFFFLAFGWSWILWLPQILWGFNLYLAPFGPTVAALVTVYTDKGIKGIKMLLKKAINLKFNKLWLFPVLFLMPCIVGISYVFGSVIDGNFPRIEAFSNPLGLVAAFLQIMFLGGPVEEELGWRGYALDKLQERYNALISSVILGAIWGFWHLPLFFMPGQDIYRNVPIVGFVMGAIFLSILFTWIYNNTNKSVLAVILFHTTSNFGQYVFPALQTKFGGLISVVLNLIIALLVLIIFKPKTLTKVDANLK